MQISPNQYAELIKKSYSLDHIYLLKLIEKSYDLTTLRKESIKIDNLYFSLIRKGLITEDEKLSTEGIRILKFVHTTSEVDIPLKRRESTSSLFDEWWKEFPGTDSYEYKGKIFKGARSLRTAKDQCKAKFDKILLEGEYSAQQLIDALKLDIEQKKEKSIMENKNILTYLQNSLTYLNQRSFEPYIELLQEEKIISTKSTSFTGTDI